MLLLLFMIIHYSFINYQVLMKFQIHARTILSTKLPRLLYDDALQDQDQVMHLRQLLP